MKKLIVFLLTLSLLVFSIAAYADDSTAPQPDATVSNSVYGQSDSSGATAPSPDSTADITPANPDVAPADSGQSVSGSTYGNSVSGSTYGNDDQINNLEQQFDDAVTGNQMEQAFNILQQLDSLQNSQQSDASLDASKQEVLSAVQAGDYNGALTAMKKVLLTEHPQWAYKYLGMLYHNAKGDNQPHIYANGQEIQSDVSPIIENGRTLVPLRAIANAIGISDSNINWDSSSHTVTINYNNQMIQLPVNSSTVTVNGMAQKIDVPAQIKNSRTMVPIRFISDIFGRQVNWYPEGLVVTVDE